MANTEQKIVKIVDGENGTIEATVKQVGADNALVVTGVDISGTISLPAGVQGYMAYCTDLLGPAFLVAAVGGGAVVGPVFYDGTIWKSI